MVLKKRQNKKQEKEIAVLKKKLKKLESKKYSLITSSDIEKANVISQLKMEIANLEKIRVVDQFDLLLEEVHKRYKKI